MQDDCDLVLYDWCVAGTNQIVWNSKTARKNGKGCFLQLTEWGRLEIRDGKNNSQLIWENLKKKSLIFQNFTSFKWQVILRGRDFFFKFSQISGFKGCR